MRTPMLLTALLVAGPLAVAAAAEPWPGFRGPTGQGFFEGDPASRVVEHDARCHWKTPIPGESWSSPVVWGGRVFVTTARDEGRACHVLALDRRTGEVLWDTLVFTQALKRKEGRNSYATPTPVTDGARVYASFGDGSFAAVDVVNGKVVWTNRDYPFYGQHGLGTSLVLYRDLVIMARDGSSEGDDKALGWQTPWDQSFVIALDARTGRQRWKASRGLSRIAHVTPIVARIGHARRARQPGRRRRAGVRPGHRRAPVVRPEYRARAWCRRR